MGEEKLQNSALTGTLAIDLGSTTTVVAFTSAGESSPRLLDLPPISQRRSNRPSNSRGVGVRGIYWVIPARGLLK